MKKNEQSSVFRGIYEFEDPGGALIAAKSPHIGSADLYSGTAVIVKPNQCALIIYKGQMTDLLTEGLHEVRTENLPVLTRLANWRFGFKSPLRCEIWFFSTQLFMGRRWGTSVPVLNQFADTEQSIPIRAFGNYNVVLKEPHKFYMSMIGSRTSFDITELEEFVQGQILELLPQALSVVKTVSELGRSQDQVSKKLQMAANGVLLKYGIELKDLQVLSLLPSKEVIRALDAKAAMGIIGNKQEYLIYQAASSLSEIQSGASGGNAANDPMQMMMGLMLGKSLLAADYKEKERVAAPKEVVATKRMPAPGSKSQKFCSECGEPAALKAKFCGECGERFQS